MAQGVGVKRVFVRIKFSVMSNKTKYPECWAFFEKHARNMEGTPEEGIGKYRVPKPDMSGDFLYHDKVEVLFQLLKDFWYKLSVDSPSVYGKIQYITSNF